MRALVALFVTLVVVGLPGVAHADVRNNAWTDGGGVGSSVETGTGSGGTGSGGGGSNASAPVCSYTQLLGEDADSAERYSESESEITPQTRGKTDGPGVWSRQVCVYPNGSTTGTIVWLPQAVNPVELAQQALDYRSLPLPDVRLSPSADKVQVVGIPIWLSVDSASWKPVSASSSAGGVTVTTTATPSRVTWNGGDGNSVTCNGPGVRYDTNKPESAQQSDCTYTYRNSSASAPSQAFTMTATATWTVSWTATGTAPGIQNNGNLPLITRTTTLPVRVGEIQALNNRR